MVDATLAIGASGLIVALANVGWTVFDATLRDRPKLKITLNRELYATDESEFTLLATDSRQWEARRSGSRDSRIHLIVTNEGRRSVTILEAGLEFADELRAAFQPGRTAELAYGQWLSFDVSEKGLAQMLDERAQAPRRIYARDPVHGIHRRKLPSFVTTWMSQLIRIQPPEEDGTSSAG